MDQHNENLYFPLNLVMIILISIMGWGIDGLILCGLVLAPTILFLLVNMFFEAAYGVQPLKFLANAMKRRLA
jgi:hypothetical protein